MTELDYYRLLGIPKDASKAQIKARYQLLAKKLHPDHSGDAKLMSLINEAYTVLSDQKERDNYDHRPDSKQPEKPAEYTEETPPPQAQQQPSNENQQRVRYKKVSREEQYYKLVQAILRKRAKWQIVIGAAWITTGLVVSVVVYFFTQSNTNPPTKNGHTIDILSYLIFSAAVIYGGIQILEGIANLIGTKQRARQIIARSR